MILVGNMTKVTMDAQLSGSLNYGNIRYVVHINYMQDRNNVKYESYSSIYKVDNYYGNITRGLSICFNTAVRYVN
jgi:hypothetical protein